MDETEEKTPEQSAAESDAAFASGFNEARGIETPKAIEKPIVEKPAEKPKAEGAATSDSEKPEVDEWAGVPPKVKAEFDSLRGQLSAVEKVPDRLRAIEGNLGGLSQLTKELKVAVAAATTAAEVKGKEAPTPAQVEFAAKSPERWKELQRDFPEWAEVMTEELGAVRAEMAAIAAKAPTVDTNAIKTEITSEIDKRIASAVKDAETRARVHAYLDFRHDGWQESVNSPEFEAWWKAQPKETQALSASADVKDAVKMLDLFAAHQKKLAQKAENDKRLARAIAPQGTVAPAVLEDPEAAFADGFNSVRNGG